MKIDPTNPLLNLSSTPPPSISMPELDDLDLMIKVDLIKATAPFYAQDLGKWKEVLNELFDWVYDADGIEFRPDDTQGEG
jgi:hypothetical protein